VAVPARRRRSLRCRERRTLVLLDELAERAHDAGMKLRSRAAAQLGERVGDGESVTLPFTAKINGPVTVEAGDELDIEGGTVSGRRWNGTSSIGALAHRPLSCRA
jgi:hypothetical protein